MAIVWLLCGHCVANDWPRETWTNTSGRARSKQKSVCVSFRTQLLLCAVSCGNRKKTVYRIETFLEFADPRALASQPEHGTYSGIHSDPPSNKLCWDPSCYCLGDRPLCDEWALSLSAGLETTHIHTHHTPTHATNVYAHTPHTRTRYYRCRNKKQSFSFLALLRRSPLPPPLSMLVCGGLGL